MEDPVVDGFGHHNPQLGQEDDLFYNALAINRLMEGFFSLGAKGHLPSGYIVITL